jgi:hypothetical protein
MVNSIYDAPGEAKVAYMQMRYDNPRKLKIGLDFDGTVTEDPCMWGFFVLNATTCDHEVTIVTFRQGPLDHPENKDIKEFVREYGAEVIFTGGKQKADCYKADVWIDDMPELIPGKTIKLAWED